MKLLIIEDDKNLNNSLKEILSQFGSIDSCYAGSDAIYMTDQNIYDLIILDLMLPFVSGLDVLTHIRKTSNVPVLILTAKATITDKVQGLRLGADDYLTKPYHNDELIARVSAILRRTNNEFRDFDEKMKELYSSKYMDYIIDNNWEIPSVKNLDKKVQSGELIYVENYIRSDGTKVHGYYRRKPYYSRKN